MPANSGHPLGGLQDSALGSSSCKDVLRNWIVRIKHSVPYWQVNPPQLSHKLCENWEDPFSSIHLHVLILRVDRPLDRAEPARGTLRELRQQLVDDDRQLAIVDALPDKPPFGSLLGRQLVTREREAKGADPGEAAVGFANYRGDLHCNGLVIGFELDILEKIELFVAF